MKRIGSICLLGIGSGTGHLHWRYRISVSGESGGRERAFCGRPLCGRPERSVSVYREDRVSGGAEGEETLSDSSIRISINLDRQSCGNGSGSGLLSQTRIGGNIRERAAALCQTKLSDSLASILILAFFCGILMYVAVEGFRSGGNPLIVIFSVSVFILCGFEHCIANMFYFSWRECGHCRRWVICW